MTHQPSFPALLEKALNLTKVVASEDYGVYAEFLGHEDDTYRLAIYLDKIREASLVSLEKNGRVGA
jgi:nuclear pore complex protein Nup107